MRKLDMHQTLPYFLLTNEGVGQAQVEHHQSRSPDLLKAKESRLKELVNRLETRL
jgi:hypothetical protein